MVADLFPGSAAGGGAAFHERGPEVRPDLPQPLGRSGERDRSGGEQRDYGAPRDDRQTLEKAAEVARFDLFPRPEWADLRTVLVYVLEKIHHLNPHPVANLGIQTHVAYQAYNVGDGSIK